LRAWGFETNTINRLKNTSTQTARKTLNDLTGKVIGLRCVIR